MTPKERLAVVRDGLASVWDSQGRSFVTFEADTGRGDDAPWVQYLDGVLNLEWPQDEDPNTALPRLGVTLPAGAFVVSHAPGGTTQIAVGDVRLDEVAGLVTSLFERVIAPECADLRCRVEQG